MGTTARLLHLLAGVWGGLILGVSFLATIAKFSAPSLSLAVALDVGRYTFRYLVQVEWLLSGMVIVLLLLARPRVVVSALWLLSISLLAIEAFWLLPPLDERVGLILAGGAPPPSAAHQWFIGIEASRALLLLALGWLGVVTRAEAAVRDPVGTPALVR